MPRSTADLQLKTAQHGVWMRLLGVGYAVFVLWLMGIARTGNGEQVAAILWENYSWVGRAAIVGFCVNVPFLLGEVFLEKLDFRETDMIHRDRWARARKFRYAEIKCMNIVAGKRLDLEFSDGRRIRIFAALMDPREAKTLIDSRRD